MTLSLDGQIAVMDQKVSAVVNAASRIEAAQQQQNKYQQEAKLQIQSLEHRLASVESKLAAATPTLDEFVQIKHKVSGAGALGKWLWAAGGTILGMAAVTREQIYKAIVGH